MSKTKIFLSNDKIIAGVCAGLAERFDIDPFWIRLITALLLFNGPAVIFVYLIMWWIMPKKSNI